MVARSVISDPEVKARALELFAQNLTFEEVAQRFETTRKAIQREIKRDPAWGELVRAARRVGSETRRLVNPTASELAAAAAEQAREAIKARKAEVVKAERGLPEPLPVPPEVFLDRIETAVELRKEQIAVAKAKRKAREAAMSPPPLAEKWWAGDRPTAEEILVYMGRLARTDGHPLQAEALKTLAKAALVELRGEVSPPSAAIAAAREKAEQDAEDAVERPHVPRGLTVLALPESEDVELDGGEVEEADVAVADVG